MNALRISFPFSSRIGIFCRFGLLELRRPVAVTVWLKEVCIRPVRGYAERNAINAPIQGSAADIIKVAMARIYQRFQTEGIQAKMILQVHDELNFSVPVEEKERVEEIVIEEMEHAYRMHVPLKADCGWGKNWLEAH